MKLFTQVSMDVNTEDGTGLNWHAEPYRLDEGIWVRIVDETGKVIFEMELAEWERVAKAVFIASKAESEVEELATEEGEA